MKKSKILKIKQEKILNLNRQANKNFLNNDGFRILVIKKFKIA